MVVGLRMIRDFGQRSTLGGDGPYVGIAVFVVFLAGAIRHEGDALAIGRPLRVAVVPVLAVGNLLGVAALDVDHPEMTPLIVEPAGVVEIVGNVLVVAHVAVFGAGL